MSTRAERIRKRELKAEKREFLLAMIQVIRAVFSRDDERINAAGERIERLRLRLAAREAAEQAATQ